MNSATLLVVLLVGVASSTHVRTKRQSLEQIPTTNLMVVNGKDRTEVLSIISQWALSSVGGNRGRTLYQTDNWRIDFQGTHPDRTGKYRGLMWANLQVQLGGKSRDSQQRAQKLRDKGKSTSVAEVHALVDSQVGAGIFQRAFTISLDNGVQVWIHPPAAKSSGGASQQQQGGRGKTGGRGSG